MDHSILKVLILAGRQQVIPYILKVLILAGRQQIIPYILRQWTIPYILKDLNSCWKAVDHSIYIKGS